MAFLASEEAGSVTGQTIGIDGGVGLNTQTLGSSALNVSAAEAPACTGGA